MRRGRGQPLPARFDAALQLCLARELWRHGRAEEALAAVSSAVETVPGDAKLIAFEDRARADTADAAGLGALDVRHFLLGATEVDADDHADAADASDAADGAVAGEGKLIPDPAMPTAPGADGTEP